MKKIYLDNNATTRVDDNVIENMKRYFNEIYGNASSIHSFGQDSKEAIENTRKKIKSMINGNNEQLIFTGSGTESDNMALRGIAYADRDRGNHILVSSIEHSAVMNTAKSLMQEGFFVEFIPVNSKGIIDIDFIKNHINSKTILISVMHANNETGSIQPIEEVCKIAHKYDIVFHTDAVQTIGKINVDVKEMDIDLLTASGHKFHAPKGIGFLYKKRHIKLNPIIFGGNHEFGLRSGTHNVPGIVGMGIALENAIEKMDNHIQYITKLRDMLIKGIKEIPDTIINTPIKQSIYNTLNVSFKNINSAALLVALNNHGIMISAGSACSAAEHNPSHVLMAMGRSAKQAGESIRLSLSKYNTVDEINYTIDILKKEVKRIRDISPKRN